MLYRQTYVVDGQTFVAVNDQQFNVVISPTEKSVILHPVINGEVDTTIVIYPQTVADNVIGLDEKILEAVLPKQDKSNLVTELSAESTNTQYPSAKLVYDELQTKQDNLTAGNGIDITNAEISADTLTISDVDAIFDGGYSVTATIVKGTVEGDSSILFDSITLTIVPNVGYCFPDTVIVENAQYTYDNTTGVLILSNPTGDVTVSALCRSPSVLTVVGLGAQDPTTVVFSEEGDPFDWNFPEVTVDGNVFIKIPTMYRKVNTVVDNQITSFSLADSKIDNDYQPYPCFLDSDGTTVLPYVLIGKYCSSSTSVMNSVNASPSTQTLATGRTNARALGTGYQLYDWQIQKLFVDLAMMKAKTVNFNSGQTISEYLGIAHMDQGIWIDGIYHNNETWYVALNPVNYVSEPSGTPTGYSALSYSCPTTYSTEVQKLGYDSTNPFVNYPSAVVSNSSFDTYYCDGYYYSSGSRPPRSVVGNANANAGFWLCDVDHTWTYSYGVRLCYKPISA